VGRAEPCVHAQSPARRQAGLAALDAGERAMWRIVSAVEELCRIVGWTLVVGIGVILFYSYAADRTTAKDEGEPSLRVQLAPAVPAAIATPVPDSEARPKQKKTSDDSVFFDPQFHQKNALMSEATGQTRTCMRGGALGRLHSGERSRKQLELWVVQTCGVALRGIMRSINVPGADELLQMLAVVEVENAIVFGR
jgi:hypothetical protein